MSGLRALERVAYFFLLGPLLSLVRYGYLLWASGVSLSYILVRMSRRLKASRSHVDGWVAPGFERVADVYRHNIESRQDQGSAFSVYYKGALVVDLWGGYADRNALRYREKESIGMFYSSTKAVTAVCMAMLVDRGVLDYDMPVSHYWPEFSQEGKGDITVRTLLSHQAGLIAIRDKHKLSLLKDDPVEMGTILAKQRPFFRDNAVAYHTLTYGLYADQLMRKVDQQGRSLAKFFQDEVAKEFDVPFYIGLPRSLHHLSCREVGANFGLIYLLTTLLPVGINFLARIIYSYIKFGTFYLTNLIGNPSDWKLPRLNDPKFREIPSPASHGFGTARAVAKLMGILGNGGKFGNKRLLSEERIADLNTPVGKGLDRVILKHLAYGPGVVINQPKNPQGKLRNVFGHWGAGGQMAYTDPTYRLGWAYNTNFSNLIHGFVMDHRYAALEKAMFDCVYAMEGPQKDD